MKTWFVTGIGSGFGHAIATAAIEAGDRVIGTVRNESQRAEFAQSAPGRSYSLLLDVTEEEAITTAVERVEREIGPIDVLVNNAGYGHEGVFEESSMEELRRQFEVNVFGAVAVTKSVLPYMRQRRRGHIINITSMGGVVTMPGLSFYHGSKFALEGLSESLGKEVETFGIRVTAVEPGSFRTDWAGRSMVRAQRVISDYDNLMNPIREARQARSGRQQGNPRKLGIAIVRLAHSDNPPAHLLLGSDAYRLVIEKLDNLRAEYVAWKDVAESTDFTDQDTHAQSSA